MSCCNDFNFILPWTWDEYPGITRCQPQNSKYKYRNVTVMKLVHTRIFLFFSWNLQKYLCRKHPCICNYVCIICISVTCGHLRCSAAKWLVWESTEAGFQMIAFQSGNNYIFSPFDIISLNYYICLSRKCTALKYISFTLLKFKDYIFMM